MGGMEPEILLTTAGGSAVRPAWPRQRASHHQSRSRSAWPWGSWRKAATVWG